MPWRSAERRTSGREPGYESAGRPPARPPGDRWFCPTVGICLPVRKRPAPEDAVTARQTLLDGLARDADIFELLSDLAPLHPRDNTFPGASVSHVR